MSAQYQQLRAKLAELFQLDAAAELDFGIYRILNARRVEIGRFLDGLQPEVEAIIKSLLDDKSSAAQTEAEKLKAQLEAAGVDPEQSPKFLKLKEEAALAGGSTFELENEIFSRLTTFFSRYYKDGDFLSLRRYKRDTYAIPYEGEEVKLHWANADQFYIKSAENFRDYTFRLGPAPKDGTPDTRPRVTFKLTEADTERDNNKAVAGKERRFSYQGLVEQTADALVLGFEYRALNGEEESADGDEDAAVDDTAVGKKKRKKKDQATLNREAVQRILAECARGPFAEIAAKRPTEKNKERTLLEKHLTDYTARNTFDYFIHKDLGAFLRRELDFYLKNEVLHLDDLEAAPEPGWRQQQARLKALRTIAHKVIRFLAQIEDFQKRLWLKKKFVTRCDYVITLDRLPAALLPEVAACAAQREEWVRLLAIDEITADLGRIGYGVPLTVEFLKENASLPLDTRHFGEEFRRKVQAGIENEGASLDGVLIRSENFGALNFLSPAKTGRIKLATIDPPYNTGVDGFMYRDNFQHSSWATMLFQALTISKRLLTDNAALFCNMDDNEAELCHSLLSLVFGRENDLGAIIWKKRGGPPNDRVLGAVHEFIYAYRVTECDEVLSLLPRHDESKARYLNPDNDPDGPWVAGDLSANAKGGRFVQSLYFNILNPKTGEKHLPPEGACWRFNAEKVLRLVAEGVVFFGADGKGRPKFKRYLKDVRDGLTIPSIWDSVATNTNARSEINALFGENNAFDTVKPVALAQRIVYIGARADSTVLDYFAGSGTTGHAVIDLNREDNGTRKYVLVEMGEHFDTVLVPRLKKVIYAKDWKDGKPASRNTGVSHCCKILRLESYEDTLNNLRLPARRPEAQELALAEATPAAREEYTLGYMLELETQGSPSLLNVTAFTDPWNYTLDVATGTAGETRPVAVDLVETFNWLLGLTVRHTDYLRGVCAVDGTNPGGERVLILWRNTAEVDAEALNEWFTKQGYSTRDLEYALIYVNGDHHLENLRRDDQTWKVRLIDEEFPRLMWEGCQ